MTYVPPPFEPIAIIGSSCRFPGGANSSSKLWALLTKPTDLSKEAPPSRFNAQAFYHPDGERPGTTNALKGYWLEQNPRVFDASFFNITPKEAEAMDPQHKLLLETVYEGMESAGLTLQNCWGQPVSVHVGLMTADFENLSQKDKLATSQYAATGTSRALASNRISYFFNWRGPSMTIDTACSSSLVALHQAVLALRSGESTIACVAGANMMLSPDMSIVESSLHMLSPTGQSRMWDKDADGYARGKGIAVVFLKTLSSALADGDSIEAIIRETGVNSDGRTKGITMPNQDAQAQLIRATYRRTNLDSRNSLHQCQYFEAHGTGTQAGDPREAEAIHAAFFGSEGAESEKDPLERHKLLVGSIKTIIGHTEGAAGLAGLLKVSLAMKNRIIPPNQHLHALNPSVEPFCRQLEIPTEPLPWPNAPSGQPLRASVNSFGFGGTNSHAIVERYEPMIHDKLVAVAPILDRPADLDIGDGRSTHTVPHLLSANTDKALANMVKRYASYLWENQDVNLRDLAWTLCFRRSNLPHKVAFSGTDVLSLIEKMEAKIEHLQDGSQKEIGVRSKPATSHRILGIFTGQGAQWPTMGKGLITASPFFRETIKKLEDVLRGCSDPPTWSLEEQLLAPLSRSRLHDAAVSQPLCTAIQIALVDLLREVGIHLSAVVGHSSGEIAAAYAAGLLTAESAMLLAYYRGFGANSAVGVTGLRGGMLAAGLSMREGNEICESDTFKDRLFVAASNAPGSITLSGDIDAVQEAKTMLDGQRKFARLLKVEVAYHSRHMEKCAEPYLKAIAPYNITVHPPRKDCAWISSVYGLAGSPNHSELTGEYWRDNLVKPVLFAEALERALVEHGPFDAALEIGPHAALKGPAIQTMQEVLGGTMPYFGVLDRTKDDFIAFSDALGSLWSYLGPSAVDFERYSAAISGKRTRPNVLKDLPTYPWDHSQAYYRESRLQRQYLNKKVPPHELLGMRVNDDSDTELRWRNILRTSAAPWVRGHRFQDQIILPVAAYCVMAYDAARILAGSRPVRMIELRDLEIKKAITVQEDSQGVELLSLLSLESENENSTLIAKFSLSSTTADGKGPLRNALTCNVFVHLGIPDAETLPSRIAQKVELNNVDINAFYSTMQDLGLSYTGPFCAMRGLNRRMNSATGVLKKPHPDDSSQLSISPALLDSCFQTIFAAIAAPGDGALWTSFLPKKIRSLKFNTALCEAKPEDPVQIKVDAYITNFSPISSSEQPSFSGDIDIYNAHGQMEIQVERLTLLSFAAWTPEDDRELFLETIWKEDPFTGFSVAEVNSQDIVGSELESVCEAISTCYLPSMEERRSPGLESDEAIEHSISTSRFRPSLELLRNCAQTLPALVPGLINEITAEAQDLIAMETQVSHVTEVLSHRFPQMSVLYIDLNNGLAANAVLYGLELKFASFTYVHTAENVPDSISGILKSHPHKVMVKKFDLESLMEYSFGEKLHDLIVFSRRADLNSMTESSLRAVRAAIRPGGYLIQLDLLSVTIEERFLRCIHGPSWPSATNEQAVLKNTSDESEWAGPVHEYTTPKAGFSITVFQASNHDIKALRNPIGSISSINCPGDILIVGGKLPETSAIATRLQEVLTKWKGNVWKFPSLEDIEPESTKNLGAAIILADLDEPIMSSMDGKKLSALKLIFRPNTFMLWLTAGFPDENPYHYASVGFGRCVGAETPQLELQFLNLDTLEGSENLVVEAFLRLAISSSINLSTHLWTLEPDIILKSGKLSIPRMKPVAELNSRLNSTRRVITKDINISSSVYEVTRSSNNENDTYTARTIQRNLRTRTVDNNHIFIRALYSSAFAVRLAENMYMFLCLGLTSDGKKFLYASPDNRSEVSIPPAWGKEIKISYADEKTFLHLALRALISQQIVEKATAGPLMTHEADPPFAFAMEATLLHVNQRYRHVSYTTCDERKRSKDSQFLFIHPQATERTVKSAFSAVGGTLIDFSSKLGQTIRNGTALPPCIEVNTVLFRAKSSRSTLEEVAVNTALANVISIVNKVAPSLQTSDNRLDATPVGDVVGKGPLPFFSLLDWHRPGQVQETVHPIDPKTIFSSNGTYLLVGLTGDLGQSLCKFMVSNGARHLVITSRNPNMAPAWKEELERIGAKITVVAMDVTNLEDVRHLKTELSQSFPPVKGVMNAAMVLSDGIFSELTIEKLHQVLAPKVQGSRNLDEVFCDREMEFFVLFSSIAAAGGNKGQSSYAAANMFMGGLAGQRRRRGLAASVIDIGMLAGVGYVNRPEGSQVFKYLRKQGYPPVSEQDMHQMIVEAILAGRLDSKTSFHLTTGINRFDPFDKNPLHWHSNPRFSHHTIKSHSRLLSESNGHTESLKEQVKRGTSLHAVADILQMSLIAQLEQILQLPEGSVNSDLPIIDLGIDSLMAVEIRTWFLKEVGRDMPILRVLGGSSVSTLCTETAEDIFAENASTDDETRSTSGESSDGRAQISDPASSKGFDAPISPILTPMTEISETTGAKLFPPV